MLRSTRRRFCEQATFVSVGALSSLACRPRTTKAIPAAPATRAMEAEAPPPLSTFTAATFATLSAICERILPRDQDPGALDLGVPAFIDRQVATPELASTRAMLLRALPIFDKESRKRHDGKSFDALTPTEQDEILDTWQHGRQGRPDLFDTLVSLTMEGAFGDPKYGGNVGGRGFAMIGFRPDPPLSKMPPMPGMHHGSTP